MPFTYDQGQMRPNGHSYPPPHPSPLRKASPLPSLPDERRYTFQDSSDQADSQTPVAPHPEVSCNLDQKMMITDSPALGTSMAFTGLQLDVGYTNAASWSYPPPVSYEYSTISPSSLLQSPSHGNCRSSRKSQPQSYPSQSISSHEFDYRSSSYLSTPPSFLDDTSTALMSDNLTWTPADSVFREQCHLNVSEDDPHLGHDPPNWQAARICEPSVETSSTASDQSVHSAAMERGLSHEAHRSPSRDTSYAPSTRTPSIQLDTEPRPSRRRLTRPEDVRLRCPVCGKGFARTFNYNTHLQIHNPNRRRPCRCLHPGCDKDFFRDTDLRRHEQSVHSSCKAFRCEDCLARFPRKDSLQRHITDGCIRRPAVEKRALKLRRQKLRVQRQRQNQGLEASTDPLQADAQGDAHVDQSEYTTKSEALRLLRASAEPASSSNNKIAADK